MPSPTMKFVARASAFLLACSVPSLQAASLAVGPDYQRPTNAVPTAFRDAPEWKEATPADARGKGPWWEVFGDPQLQELMDRATVHNQSLRAAVARYDQARAAARVSRSELFPTLDFNPNAERLRYSPNQEPSFGDITATTIRTPLDLSYEVDLWGRVRRSFQSARAEAQATAADVHNTLLSIQAEVAQNYFTLRATDRQRAITRRSLKLRRDAKDILKARVDAGTAPDLDLARADTEVATAEVELLRLERSRNGLETALALLTGAPAPEFSITELPSREAAVPPVPAALPSELLERRPDVAMSERQMAAASARIGVAKAAFFPVLRLTGSAGFVSAELDSLVNWESRVWSWGPSLSLPIFAGGRNRANLARARGAYEEATARYRQQVLVAFAEVQENLTALRILAAEAEAVGRAVEAAQRTFQFATARYEGGVASYLEVIESQRTLLIAELDEAQLRGRRQATTVQLIKALGGGWTADQLQPARK